MTHVGNATLVEIVWTAASLVGATLCLLGFYDAVADLRFLKLSGLNGRRKVVAKWHVKLNGGLGLVQLTFLGSGIVAMVTPPGHDPDIRLARASIQLAFMVAQIDLVAVAYAARRYRYRLLATRHMVGLQDADPAAPLDDDDDRADP